MKTNGNDSLAIMLLEGESPVREGEGAIASLFWQTDEPVELGALCSSIREATC